MPEWIEWSLESPFPEFKRTDSLLRTGDHFHLTHKSEIFALIVDHFPEFMFS